MTINLDECFKCLKMKSMTVLRFVDGACKCGLVLILLSYDTAAVSSPISTNGSLIPEPSTTTTLSYTQSSDSSQIIGSLIPMPIPSFSVLHANTPHPFTDGSVTTTSSVVALSSIAPLATSINGSVTTTPSMVAFPSITPPAIPTNGSSVTTVTKMSLPPITPPRPFFHELHIILMALAGGVFVLLVMLAFLVCCCLCGRKKVIRASSVAELCDLSHYDDMLTCSITPTYANTMSASNNEGGSGISSSSNYNLGHAPPSTNVASTTDQNSQKSINIDEYNSDQSCQDAAGRHKIVKQMSTSSIQVSEDLDWGTVPTLSRGKGLFSRK